MFLVIKHKNALVFGSGGKNLLGLNEVASVLPELAKQSGTVEVSKNVGDF